jgi:DNA mismatch repair ATPase MutS
MYEILLYVIPISMFTVFFGAIFGWVSWTIFTVFLVIPLAFVGSYLKQINRQYYFLTRLVEKIEVLAKLTEKIEQQEFSSELLQNWRNELFEDGKKASEKIHSLRKLLDMFEQRQNILLGFLLNAFLLWDLHLLRKMYKWKVQNALDIEKWLSVVGRFDALTSIANMAYNDRSLVYPEILDTEFEISGRGLNHPLIPKNERVGNDFQISGSGSVYIVTGANMAGKSTFLRTVGMQLVLGMLGAPLAVESLRFSPIKIFSSMRAEDSLASHSSYFYAELNRLAQLSKLLKEGAHLFVVLDEILKGTNSVDKARGSYAFVEKIIQFPMMGLIATHDLSLCELESKYPDKIRNKSFEVEFVGDDLQFDYRLRDGVCQNMNASFLLKKMGIVDSY